MRQKTRRTAFGMLYPGVLAWPAATATISTPQYEKAALTEVVQEFEEVNCRTCSFVCLHGTWVVPISETKTIVCRSASEINNKGKDDKPEDDNNFETCEAEVHLTIDGYSEDVQADD
ncbi:MAG: hypothetical protein L6R35_002690 [Caloplaca aegaea]|nr:MAG: hypothetical protein L6R35_002690 [Caloplaca aegaea]